MCCWQLGALAPSWRCQCPMLTPFSFFSFFFFLCVPLRQPALDRVGCCLQAKASLGRFLPDETPWAMASPMICGPDEHMRGPLQPRRNSAEAPIDICRPSKMACIQARNRRPTPAQYECVNGLPCTEYKDDNTSRSSTHVRAHPILFRTLSMQAGRSGITAPIMVRGYRSQHGILSRARCLFWRHNSTA